MIVRFWVLEFFLACKSESFIDLWSVSQSVLTSTWPEHCVLNCTVQSVCLSVCLCFGMPSMTRIWSSTHTMGQSNFYSSPAGMWMYLKTVLHFCSQSCSICWKCRYVLRSVVYKWISGLVKSPWTFVCSSDMLYLPSLLSQNNSTIYSFCSWINHCLRIWLLNGS